MPSNRGPGEVRERLLEGDGRTTARVLVVVGHEQAPGAALVLGEHVELDHLHARLQRRVEACERVAPLDPGGALVTDPPRAAAACSRSSRAPSQIAPTPRRRAARTETAPAGRPRAGEGREGAARHARGSSGVA